MASVRRSLFTSEGERLAFLNRLVNGSREILQTKQGLAEHDNYHEFCRLLGRLKTNYQLSELVGGPASGRVGGGGQGDAYAATLPASLSLVRLSGKLHYVLPLNNCARLSQHAP